MSKVVSCLVLSSAVLTTACSHGGGGADDCQTFRTALSVKDRMSQAVTVFNPGEAINFELEITNTTNAGATLSAASSCTAVVFEVFDATQQRRWGSADGVNCMPPLVPRTYAALETVTESQAWDQTDSGGTRVTSGQYQVKAEVGQYASSPSAQGPVDCRAQLNRSMTFLIQ